MNNDKSFKLMLTLPAVLLGGCLAGPTTVADNFGESVRQMVRAQTLDQSTLSSPSPTPVVNTDGQLLEGALETYRTTVSDQTDVGSEVIINVGNQQ